MKMFLLFVLALMLLGYLSNLFAEHARVMPENVGRVYFMPSYQWGDEAFNDDGDSKRSNSLKVFNLGLALEHGVNSWLTAALQWTPGYNLWSDVERYPKQSAPTKNSAEIKDMGDLFIGAKMQLIGPKALLQQSDEMRLAIAPGIKLPLTKGPDFEKEYKKMAGGDDYNLSKLDKHVLAAGWRFYFDYLFTKEFYVNLYNETIFYVQKGKAKNLNMQAGGALAKGGALIDAGDVDYGYDLTFEIEPNYQFDVADKTTLELALPVSYKSVTAPECDFTGAAMASPTMQATVEAALGKKTEIIQVKPTVGIFFRGWAVPIELKLGYFMPVWGKNTNNTNTINSQIRVYYKI